MQPIVSHAKTAEPIEMPFGVWTREGPRNHVFDRVSRSPMRTGNFKGKGRPIVKYRNYLP